MTERFFYVLGSAIIGAIFSVFVVTASYNLGLWEWPSSLVILLVGSCWLGTKAVELVFGGKP